MIGQVLSHYRISAALGAGGMGEVSGAIKAFSGPGERHQISADGGVEPDVPFPWRRIN